MYYGSNGPGGFSSTSGWPDPFNDAASRMMPSSLPAMLRHSEAFGLQQPTFRAALERLAAYFLTDLELSGDKISDIEIREYKDELVEDAGIMGFLLNAAIGMLVYGNVWCSVLEPFKRMLRCPRRGCGAVYGFDQFAADENKHVFNFAWKDAFTGRCPACSYVGDFGKPIDKADRSTPVIFRIWNPYDIRPNYVEWEGRSSEYVWAIPSEFRTSIKSGKIYDLAATPWEVLQAVINNEDFKFSKDFVFHWTDSVLPGVRSRGIGISRAIVNYRTMYYIQTLMRFSEALAMAHITPFRMVSPKAGIGGDAGDVLKNLSQSNMQSQFMGMLARHKKDPHTWHYSPVPLEYQALGADARQLTPKELLDFGNDTLLNGAGMPVDLYKGNLQVQAAPVGLRLFERFNQQMVQGYNRLTAFAVNRVVAYKRWEPIKAKLASVTVVDSIEKSQLVVQMAMSGALSQGKALKVVGADYADETRRKADEQLTAAIIQQEFQDKTDALGLGTQVAQQTNPLLPVLQGQQGQQQGGGQQGQQPQSGQAQGQPGQAQGQQPQGQPATPSPTDKLDPQQYMSMADAWAQWLDSLPEGNRIGPMTTLKKTNSAFHAAVKAALEKLRSSDRSQGQQMMRQQRGAQQ